MHREVRYRIVLIVELTNASPLPNKIKTRNYTKLKKKDPELSSSSHAGLQSKHPNLSFRSAYPISDPLFVLFIFARPDRYFRIGGTCSQ